MRFGASIASLLTISSTFNSLFKVLCFFPSRYLCAIGLSPVFIFRWNLPPNYGLHSQTTRLDESATRVHVAPNRLSTTGLSPSMIPHSKGVGPWRTCVMPPPKTTIRRLSTSLPFDRDKGFKTSRILNLSWSRFTRSYYGNPR
jgi:hypothetical protein